MTLPQETIAELRATALRAARAGGTAALHYFRQPALPVEWKADDSPVTVADREAEDAIKGVILAAYPDDGWLGEETGSCQGTTGRRWIVDPIDGTRNFVRGVPLWATLVACVAGEGSDVDDVLASAVLIPALDEAYDAGRGAGACCNGQSISVSRLDGLDQALVCYETPGWFQQNGLGRVFDELCQRTHLQRGLCDAYGHMLVASGRAELVVEPQLSIWDLAAPSLVVTEAGGRFSDLLGTPTIGSGNAVVSNGLVHEAALALIAELKSG